MKKNIIMLVIDSCYYKEMDLATSNNFTTPFINELIKSSISTSRMYSQAPFTEAAMLNLYCGSNVLDDDGYLLSYKNKVKVLPECFIDNGYDVVSYILPYIMPSQQERGISDLYYQRMYDFKTFYEFRLYYYISLYKKNKMTNEDIDILVELLDDNIRCWLDMINKLIHNDKSVELISRNIKGYDLPMIYEQVKKEYLSFNDNKEKYLINLLKEGKKHRLFKIETIKLNNKIKNEEFKNKLNDKYCDFIKESEEINSQYNKKNNKANNKINNIYSLMKYNKGQYITTIKDWKKYPEIINEAFNDSDFKNRINTNYDNIKEAPSVNTIFDHYLNYVKHREKEKPLFSYIHFDDIHNPEIFFTYDSEDESLIDEEFKVLKEYKNNIKPNFKGSLSYKYSLRYMDLCIEKFYNKLNEMGVLEDTYFIITADHGFSFTYNPIRMKYVNNFYDENYNIPFIINGYSNEGVQKNNIYCSKDIPATILDLMKINKPNSFTGNSILDEKYNNKYIYHEYMGGGCPDIEKRHMYMCIKSKEYSITYRVKLKQLFNSGEVVSIFDLKNDPFELKNKAYKGLPKNDIVNEMMKWLNNRFLEIKKSSYSIDK